MQQSPRPASFLASVTNETEARLCVSLGADIIDAKKPDDGALGALPLATVRAIRASVAGEIPVSATIGDPAHDPERTAEAVQRTAATGADIVKVGLSSAVDVTATLLRLSKLALGRVRLVAVLLVDGGLDLSVVPRVHAAGLAGVMLDTGDKRNGALPELVSSEILRAFIAGARNAGLFAGFAGSLRASHVPHLLAFGPDVLGFRGGLCRAGERIGAIDAEAVRAVRRAIPKSETAVIEPCRRAALDAMARGQTDHAL